MPHCMIWMEVQNSQYMDVLRIGKRGVHVLIKCKFSSYPLEVVIKSPLTLRLSGTLCSNIGLPFYGRSFGGTGMTGFGQTHAGYADMVTWSDDEGSPQCKYLLWANALPFIAQLSSYMPNIEPISLPI